MKYVKMLGLAAVAAAALMAFVGSSTASATVLCKTTGTGSPTGTTCPSGWAYPAGTPIHAVSIGITKLTTTFKNIECEESTASGKTDNEGSATETVTGKIEVLTFEKCNCEVKVLKDESGNLKAGSLEIHWIEGTHNGTLTSKNAEVTASCSTILGTVHCIYATGVGTHIGTVTGGHEDAVLHIEENNIPRLPTSAACAEKAHWDGTYTVTSPSPLFVTGHT